MKGFIKYNDVIFEIINIPSKFPLNIINGELTINCVNVEQIKIVKDHYNKIWQPDTGKAAYKKDYAYDCTAIVNGKYYKVLNVYISSMMVDPKDHRVDMRYDFIERIDLKDYFTEEEETYMASLGGLSKYNL